MRKTINNLLLRTCAMLVLLLGTSLTASAAYYVKGSFDSWGVGVEMTQISGEQTWYCDVDFPEGTKEFKIYNSDGNVWWGSSNTINGDDSRFENGNGYSTVTLSSDGSISNVVINWGVAASFRFYYHQDQNNVTVCHVPNKLEGQPKTAGTGAVTFWHNDQQVTEAVWGQTVQIKAAPATGYYAENANIKAETALPSGLAQAPGRTPSIGQTLTVTGDALATSETPGEYTLELPGSGLGVLVTVDFQECIDIADADIADIPNQNYTGEAIEPALTVTYGGEPLTAGTDYTAAYSNNTNAGTATVTITGKGKYKGTATKNFTIALVPHDVIIEYNDGDNPAVDGCSATANPTQATQGTTVTLTVTITNNHYALDRFEIWDANATASQVSYVQSGTNTYTFTMPNTNVYVKPYFVNTAHDVVVQYQDTEPSAFPAVDGCTVTANPTVASQGETITLTVAISNADYELKEIVTWPEGITITKVNETTYTFVMPNENAYVKPHFTKVPKLFLVGDFNSWNATATPFTKQQDGTWRIDNLTFDAAGNFQVVNENNEWLGGANDNDVDEYSKTDVTTPNSKNLRQGTYNNFRLGVAGIWTFVVNAARTTLTVTGEYDYAITIIDDSNATVTTVPADRASAKQTVTVTVTPATGYTPTLTVNGASDNQPIATTQTGTNTYTFEMPYQPVIIRTTADMTIYNVTCDSEAGATGYAITAAPTQGTYGTQINLTPAANTPADFEVVNVVVTPAEGNPFDATKDENGWHFNMPASDVTVSAVVEAKLHGVKFTATNHFATYIGGYDLSLPEGVSAYAVTGATANAEVTVQELPYIPQGGGVLLYCEDNKANITTPLYEGTTDTYTTKLVGNLSDAPMATGEGYLLYNDQFYLSQAGTLAAHRCYISADALDGGSQPAPAQLRIRIAPIVVTGIEGVNDDNVKSVKYVNLNGVVSDTPFEGINIMLITNTDGTTRTVKMVK